MKLREGIVSLLTDKEGSISSKRFIAVILSFTVIVLSIADAFWKKTPSEFIWWGLISLIASSLGLNTLISAKSITSKQEVAGKIIENAPVPEKETDAARDIMQDQPKKTEE